MHAIPLELLNFDLDDTYETDDWFDVGVPGFSMSGGGQLVPPPPPPPSPPPRQVQVIHTEINITPNSRTTRRWTLSNTSREAHRQRMVQRRLAAATQRARQNDDDDDDDAFDPMDYFHTTNLQTPLHHNENTVLSELSRDIPSDMYEERPYLYSMLTYNPLVQPVRLGSKDPIINAFDVSKSKNDKNKYQNPFTREIVSPRLLPRRQARNFAKFYLGCTRQEDGTKRELCQNNVIDLFDRYRFGNTTPLEDSVDDEEPNPDDPEIVEDLARCYHTSMEKPQLNQCVQGVTSKRYH